MPLATVLGATIFVVVACVLIHYQAFRALSAVWSRYRVRRRTWIVVTLCLLMVHCIEITLFAALYAGLQPDPALGSLLSGTADSTMSFGDLLYYSSVVYTTLGFGDWVPVGWWRLVTGIEALAGFSLITWSASFTFLQMQQFWES